MQFIKRNLIFSILFSLILGSCGEDESLFVNEIVCPDEIELEPFEPYTFYIDAILPETASNKDISFSVNSEAISIIEASAMEVTLLLTEELQNAYNLNLYITSVDKRCQRIVPIKLVRADVDATIKVTDFKLSHEKLNMSVDEIIEISVSDFAPEDADYKTVVFSTNSPELILAEPTKTSVKVIATAAALGKQNMTITVSSLDRNCTTTIPVQVDFSFPTYKTVDLGESISMEATNLSDADVKFSIKAGSEKLLKIDNSTNQSVSVKAISQMGKAYVVATSVDNPSFSRECEIEIGFPQKIIGTYNGSLEEDSSSPQYVKSPITPYNVQITRDNIITPSSNYAYDYGASFLTGTYRVTVGSVKMPIKSITYNDSNGRFSIGSQSVIHKINIKGEGLFGSIGGAFVNGDYDGTMILRSCTINKKKLEFKITTTQHGVPTQGNISVNEKFSGTKSM